MILHTSLSIFGWHCLTFLFVFEVVVGAYHYNCYLQTDLHQRQEHVCESASFAQRHHDADDVHQHRTEYH